MDLVDASVGDWPAARDHYEPRTLDLGADFGAMEFVLRRGIFLWLA